MMRFLHSGALIPALLMSALLGAAATSGGRAAEAPSPADILRDVSRTYRGLKSYVFQGATTTEVTQGSARQNFEAPLLAARRAPGKLRSEVRDDRVGTLLVCDGDSVWSYVAQFRQYTRTPLPRPGSTDSIGGQVADILAQYSRMEQLGEARLLREESVQADGRMVECYVIQSTARPSFGQVQVDSFNSEYWIDKRRHVVLKESSYARLL